MPTKTVQRRTTPKSGVAGKFLQFVVLQAQAKDLTKRAGVLKEDLMAFAEANGEKDENGHLLHTLASPVDAGESRFAGFTRQRKVKQTFLEDKAEALLTKKKVERADFITTTEYVDQEKVARLYAQGVLTEKEFDSLIAEEISWAFVPVKA